MKLRKGEDDIYDKEVKLSIKFNYFNSFIFKITLMRHRSNNFCALYIVQKRKKYTWCYNLKLIANGKTFPKMHTYIRKYNTNTLIA